MPSRRISAGIRRVGIVLALILALPLFFGFWTWVTLGHTPPRYVYLLLAAGLGAYVMATSINWIIEGFSGDDDTPSL